MGSDMPQGRPRAMGIGGPRNGMPPRVNYAYRGTGRDTLTPPGVIGTWNARLRAQGADPDAMTREGARRRTAAEISIALGRHAEALPLPPPRRPAMMPPPQDQAPAVEPARDAGTSRCESCGYLETVIGHRISCGGGD